MSENSIKSLLNPSLISKWIIDRQFIWQMRFLSGEDLCRMAHDRGLGFWTLSDDIQRLWQIGLLRADLVISNQALDIDGLVLIEQNEEGEYLYSDARDCINKPDGLGGIIEELTDLPSSIYLMFHPFRYYVLYRIERIFELSISPMQILCYPEGYQDVVKRHIEFFNKWSAEENFREQVRSWNEITSLAVAAEPFTFRKLFGVHSIPYPHYKNKEEFFLTLQDHRADYGEVLKSIGLDKVREMISELCEEAETLEPNNDVHLVLRLSERKYRLERVKGRLGGAMYLLTMAEMLRRSAEMVFETELPEEDEMGFGSDSGNYKTYFYGSQRLIDNYKARSEFLRDLRLDYGVRLRWYVEGDTELSALESALGGNELIDIINLRGDVIAKRGKGLSFKENLLNDIRRSIYSWVSLDGDVENNLRMLLKAVEKDEMFGMFFISKPDFEFANFTLEELVEILWDIALERGAESDEKQKFLEETSSAKTGKELLSLAKKAIPSLLRVDKGKVWGEKLMRLALKNHKMQLADENTKTRPVIEAMHLALRTINCNYHLSRKECKVDVTSGKIVNCKKEGASIS
jgi:hypothetical protein